MVTVGERQVLSADDGRFVIEGICLDDPLRVVHPAYEPYEGLLGPDPDHVDIRLEEDLEVIVVEQGPADARDPHARGELSDREMARSRGEDVAEALSRVPGVTVLRTSGDTSKPMVRGVYGRRLVLLRDGFRHASQTWGDDHAPEVDPFAVGNLAVVRGAAGVRYGPDAIGGVVLLEPAPMRRDRGVGGAVDLVAVSNGSRGIGAAQVDVANGKGDAVRLAANAGKGSDLRAPDYVLGNTASQTWNAGITAERARDTYRLQVGWRHHAFDGGICFCVRSGSPAELLNSVSAPVPLGSESWTVQRTPSRPRQSVHHDLAFARLVVPVGASVFEVAFDTQLNRRLEFDTARNAVEGPQFDFTLRTHTLQSFYRHGPLHVGSLGTVEGTVGAEARLQENVFRGLPLVPNHRARSVGAFWMERFSRGHTLVEVGARIDHQSRATFLDPTTKQGHVRRGTLDEASCEDTPTASRCVNAWTAPSVSVGAVWHDAAERVEARVDLSSATRFPNGDELYLAGAAPTQPVFGLGHPDLEAERTWAASPTVGLDLDVVRVEAAAFVQRIDDYIAFRPERSDDGQPAVDVTAAGAFPRYAFSASDVLYSGLEGELAFTDNTRWTARITGSRIRAVERRTGGLVPFVPPDRASLVVDLHPRGPEGFVVSGSVHGVARQSRSDESIDLAPPPDGVVLVDLALDVPLTFGDERLDLGLVVQNVANTAYRSYTSLNRFFADEPGREVRARARLSF